jgi:solute carrier family 25 (adenine nucleotide translocator) protein 4/5/6/31
VEVLMLFLCLCLAAVGKDAGKYKNSLDCARQILATEGIKSMYKGAGSNILRGLAGALVLVSFDYCKNFYRS